MAMFYQHHSTSTYSLHRTQDHRLVRRRRSDLKTTYIGTDRSCGQVDLTAGGRGGHRFSRPGYRLAQQYTLNPRRPST